MAQFFKPAQIGRGRGAATALPPVPVLVGEDQLRESPVLVAQDSRGEPSRRRPKHAGASLDSRAARHAQPCPRQTNRSAMEPKTALRTGTGIGREDKGHDALPRFTHQFLTCAEVAAIVVTYSDE